MATNGQKLTLGDAFNRRKKLGADIDSWIQRLTQAGAERREYRTREIEGSDAFVPEVGTEKSTRRHYTVEECQERIRQLLEEDQTVARRISLTNQCARASVLDLEGVSRELSVPELLVLKNEIIPKLEQFARATPIQAEGVNVFETGDGCIRHRTIRKVVRKKEAISEKGLKIEETILEGYDVVEVTDYGRPRREVWNETDRIQEFAERVKQAINEANKTELVEL